MLNIKIGIIPRDRAVGEKEFKEEDNGLAFIG